MTKTFYGIVTYQVTELHPECDHIADRRRKQCKYGTFSMYEEDGFAPVECFMDFIKEELLEEATCGCSDVIRNDVIRNVKFRIFEIPE